MSSMTDPQPQGFRLGMLISDTRYRSYTFQFIALIILIASIAYLISNLLANLAANGLDISWAYLGEPAGYDINQRPIEYDSQSTHARASIVGAINTLIVAFLACVSATILGVIAGVLRLSNNWIVSRLMSFYVEAFRNVPVLIWILIIFLAMSNILPQPRAFRGEAPDATMLLDAVAFTNRGIYVPTPVWATGTIIVFLTFILSLVAIFVYRRWATKQLYDSGKVYPTLWPTIALATLPTLMVLVLPGSPFQGLVFIALLILWVAAIYFAWTKIKQLTNDSWYTPPLAVTGALVAAYVVAQVVSPAVWNLIAAMGMSPEVATTWTWEKPTLKGFNFTDGLHLRLSLIALWFALAVYTGAFIAENVRAGIQAVSKGQTEAAASLGLRPGRIMNLVILPQALRVIIPPLISQYLNITKNSSLAIAVGYMDITGTLGGITLNQTGRAIECILLLMLFYLIISLSISAIMNVYNNSMKLKER